MSESDIDFGLSVEALFGWNQLARDNTASERYRNTVCTRINGHQLAATEKFIPNTDSSSAPRRLLGKQTDDYTSRRISNFFCPSFLIRHYGQR